MFKNMLSKPIKHAEIRPDQKETKINPLTKTSAFDNAPLGMRTK